MRAHPWRDRTRSAATECCANPFAAPKASALCAGHKVAAAAALSLRPPSVSFAQALRDARPAWPPASIPRQRLCRAGEESRDQDVVPLRDNFFYWDHAGGSSALMKACPNATLLAHPRAVNHVVDPSRLVTSAKAVYGAEAFEKLYGRIEPIPAVRVRAVQDGEIILWGHPKGGEEDNQKGQEEAEIFSYARSRQSSHLH